MNQEKSDVLTAWICIFVVSLIVGVVFSRWPDKVQRHDIQMAFYIKNSRTHRAFIQGLGYLLLALSSIAFVASIVTFFNSR